ncbi:MULTISPECIES: serpin family protein [unclassified Psychrobacter]|uniref:serpin family protein n=1 Tax=unclassified Psychrobacter TaxID=196806 RepID=UPI001184A9E2|nr:MULTISPECIES: serpin family protein [unclassified Psychrobacter]MDA5133406.1 serpin family protein [Psychrobacter sp. ANT_H3]TSB24443.1 serpin family protein [Psychrobacter sp. YGAH215]
MQNDPLRYFRYAAHNRVISALAITSLVLGVSGCDNAIKNNRTGAVTGMVTPNQPTINHQAPPTEVKALISTSEGIAEVVTANNQFAIDMYQQINGQPDQADKNVFFSPYSLSTAMAMVYAAAEGETKAQIQKTFHYPAPAILNPNSAALYNQFNKPNPDYKLATVNDLWMQQGLTPTKSYIDTVQRYYSGQVTALDFEGSPDSARQTINKKIVEKTKQMIPELLPKGSIKSDTAVVLTNAVYFKGDWTLPFTAERTSAQPFYNAIGRASTVQMMQQQSYFSYYEDKHIQVVQLPYKGDDLSMLVVLPKFNHKLAMQQLTKSLSATKIKQWRSGLVRQEVDLQLPKFKLDARYQMKTLLADMGMPKAFNNGAEFNLYADGTPIKLDEVYHQAVVTVDEKGTEAAAAAGAVGMYVGMSYPVEFKADHPFMFMIKDNKTDAILFLGQVNKP